MTASLDTSTTGQPELTDAQKAQQLYQKSLRDGTPMTGAQIGDAFGKTDRWGRTQINEVAAGGPSRGTRRAPARPPVARRRPPAGTGRPAGATSVGGAERNSDPVVVSFRKSVDGTSAVRSAEVPVPTSAELPAPVPPALPRNTPAEAPTASAPTSGEPAAGTSAEASTGRTWLTLLPLAPIGLAAFVAIWGGWVGLGKLTAFGEIELFAGIVGWKLNTAITLPIGVEAYAAYALRVWLSPPPGLSEPGRLFARWSAIGALILGAAGQIAYHLMVAAGVTSAPWLITAFVSCLPVAVLGAAAALTHLVIAGRKRARS